MHGLGRLNDLIREAYRLQLAAVQASETGDDTPEMWDAAQIAFHDIVAFCHYHPHFDADYICDTIGERADKERGAPTIS